MEWVNFFDKHLLVEYAEPNYIAYSLMVPDEMWCARLKVSLKSVYCILT
jgi:hypothetical protein